MGFSLLAPHGWL